jgi:regulatory protein
LGRARKRARSLSYRYLTARARSRKELRQYLAKKGVPDDLVDATLDEMAEDGYIDDVEFSASYGRYLVEYRGLARRGVLMELRRKGVSAEDADAGLDALFEEEEYDEFELARRLVERKAVGLEGLEPRKFRQRLTGYLQRRGFGFDVINRTLREYTAPR